MRARVASFFLPLFLQCPKANDPLGSVAMELLVGLHAKHAEYDKSIAHANTLLDGMGNGKAGTTTAKLRQALNDIQWGLAEDRHGWLTSVTS